MATTQSRPSCNAGGGGGGTRRTAGRRRRRRPSGPPPPTSPVGGGGAGRGAGDGEEAAAATVEEPGDVCGNCFPARSDSCYLSEVRIFSRQEDTSRSASGAVVWAERELKRRNEVKGTSLHIKFY